MYYLRTFYDTLNGYRNGTFKLVTKVKTTKKKETILQRNVCALYYRTQTYKYIGRNEHFFTKKLSDIIYTIVKLVIVKRIQLS